MSEERAHVTFAEGRLGKVLNGKWTLVKLLGVGGMAAVYEATHRNRKRAAIKMLHPQFSVLAATRDRFLREGYAANSVEHSGVVTVDDDAIAEDGSAYIVMELLEGETLGARILRSGGRLPELEVLAVALQVLDTLSVAHEKGIVHRDLKPENLFITRTGRVKVLDFGIARFHEATDWATATQSGSRMGTPAFMSPEQARSRWSEVDARTDLWALGATMFTSLTGRWVHQAETVNEVLALAITQEAPSVASMDPDTAPALASVIDRALAYTKERRFQSAAAMQAAVLDALTQIQGHPAPPLLSVPDCAEPSVVPVVARKTFNAATVTTGSAVTNSVIPSLRGLRISRRRAAIAAALVALASVVLLGAARATQSSSSEATPAQTATAPKVHAQQSESKPVVTNPQPASVVSAAPVLVAPTPTTTPTASAPVKRTTAQKLQTTRTRQPAATPSATAKPLLKADPFSRRR